MSRLDISESEKDELRAAWRDLRAEWTRTLFSIASAGVGFSAGVIFAADDSLSPHVRTLLLAAAVVFIALSWLCLCAFERSSDLVLYVARTKERLATKASLDLTRIQQWQKGLLMLGAATLCLAAFLHTNQGAPMSDPDESRLTSPHNFSKMLALYKRGSPAPPAAQPTEEPQPVSPPRPKLSEPDEKK
jgi:hypothetical protein